MVAVLHSIRIGVSASLGRADCGGRIFAAKLGVVVYYLPHQVFDQLLGDQAILMAAPALLDGARV